MPLLLSETSTAAQSHTELAAHLAAADVIDIDQLRPLVESVITAGVNTSAPLLVGRKTVEYAAAVLELVIDDTEACHQALHRPEHLPGENTEIEYPGFIPIELDLNNPAFAERDYALQGLLEKMPFVSVEEENLQTYLLRIAMEDPTVNLIAEFGRQERGAPGRRKALYQLKFSGFDDL